MDRRQERRIKADLRLAEEQAARQAEENRRAELSMYMRIEECDSMDRVREILHILADKAGLE